MQWLIHQAYLQVVAALRSSCSEKQKGHAVGETDHTKADTPSKQARAGVGDPTQSKEPDVEEDPPGDSDDEWLETAIATAESTALSTGEPGEGQALPLPTNDEGIILQARQSHGHTKGTDEGRPVQRPPTKEPAARTKDSPAIASLKRIKAEAEIRLQAVREFLWWQRKMHRCNAYDPAVQQREMFKFYWDMAEAVSVCVV
jgi:hypothetical protein